MTCMTLLKKIMWPEIIWDTPCLKSKHGYRLPSNCNEHMIEFHNGISIDERVIEKHKIYKQKQRHRSPPTHTDHWYRLHILQSTTHHFLSTPFCSLLHELVQPHGNLLILFFAPSLSRSKSLTFCIRK